MELNELNGKVIVMEDIINLDDKSILLHKNLEVVSSIKSILIVALTSSVWNIEEQNFQCIVGLFIKSNYGTRVFFNFDYLNPPNMFAIMLYGLKTFFYYVVFC